ncbi:MAG: gliding motility-associated C-terminal domain-containing protein [Saprospiraceae bacterium]
MLGSGYRFKLTHIICYVATILPDVSTIDVTTTMNTPIEICVPTYQLFTDLDSVAICGDPSNGTLTFDPLDTCFTYTPDTGFVFGMDTACVVICDDSGICDTTIIIITVTDQCPPVFDRDSILLITDDCDEGATYCLSVGREDIINYILTDNGDPYAGGFKGCDFRMILDVSYFSFIDAAPIGPYEIDRWVIGTDTFSATVPDIQSLVDSMNVWDPTGGWELIPGASIIRGGDLSKSYGDIRISQPLFGAMADLQFQLTSVARGTELTFTGGVHNVIITDPINGCMDTLVVTVSCDTCAIYDGPNTIVATDCDSLTNVCLDIPMSDLGNFAITYNNIAYNGPFETCDTNHVALALPIGNHEFEFRDTVNGCISQLDLMIICNPDTTGNNGGDTLITSILTGFTDTICLTGNNAPDTIFNACPGNSGTFASITPIPGTNCVEYTGLTTGTDTACIVTCTNGICDTTLLIVNVIPPTPDTVFIQLQVLTDSIYCLDGSELPGEIVSVTNICQILSGEFVIFNINPDTPCIQINAIEPGLEQGCFVFCDAEGNCDTTYIIVDVQDQLIPPIAVPDDTMTMMNTPVTIPVLTNDTIYGALNGFFIVTVPTNGTVTVDGANLIYMPRADFCGEIDSFSYAIGNAAGLDTAWVYVRVICEDINVFNGFSPNRDGMNETFKILGIEEYPDNKVLIFNRWGNKVFETDAYNNNDRVFDGTWQGKDLPDGTYFYVIEYKDREGVDHKLSGYVQIHR